MCHLALSLHSASFYAISATQCYSLVLMWNQGSLKAIKLIHLLDSFVCSKLAAPSVTRAGPALPAFGTRGGQGSTEVEGKDCLC